jgi:hypothetical protein
LNKLLAAVAVLAVSTAQADTIYVDANCPGGDGSQMDPYCSIQTAIDNAVDTDEILVAPGTYFETINFLGKAITVRSSDGQDVTTIDGQRSGTVVACLSNEGSDTILDGFMITGGSASAGAGMRIFGSSPTVRNCTFANNTATVGGGGMAVQNFSTVTLTNCTFSGNSSVIAAGILNETFSELTVIGCTFVGNSSFVGSGINSREFCTLTVIDSVLAENGNGSGGGSGIFALGGSIIVDRCIFSGNDADAALVSGSGTLLLTNSIFTGNVGAFIGGGVIDANVTSLIANCLFAGNFTAGRGGGILAGGSVDLVIVNCTFADNIPAGLTTESSTNPMVFNSVFWNNSPYQLTGNPLGTPSGASVFFSDVQGGFPGPGSNNIDADPMFVGGPSGAWTDQAVFNPVTGLTTYVDASASFVPGALVGKLLAPFATLTDLYVIADNSATTLAIFGDFAILGFPGGEYSLEDFNLTSSSPCIDAAENAAVPEEIDTDLDGNPRFLDVPETPDCQQAPGTCGDPPIVDMGAYEFQGLPCPWDLDGDGNVFITDLLLLLMDFGTCDGSPSDFDGDGCVTVVDLLTLLGNWGPCPGSPCIWDVNGDGTVDLTDLWQVFGNLGPCDGCPEDVNGDGVVNGQDAAAVATHFGPCP